MRRRFLLLVPLSLGMCAVGDPAAATIHRHAFPAGTAIVRDAGLRMEVTLGQPLVGTTSDADQRLVFGWWGPFVSGDERVTAVLPDASPLYRFGMPPSVPNPFNPRTTVRYVIPSGGGRARLRVFDLRGRLVRTLLDEHRSAGPGEVVWNGADDRGGSVASGTYVIRLELGAQATTQKVTLVK